MVFLSAPTGMIAWIISYFQVASALKRRELRRKHVSRRKVHLCRSGIRKTRRVCLMLVLVYTNMEVAKAMDQQLRQLAESAASTQQHFANIDWCAGRSAPRSTQDSRSISNSKPTSL